MKERPILFNAPMVRALLDGRKTMTRRVVKPQPASEPVFFQPSTKVGRGFFTDEGELRCPYGKPGDRLWVREAWARYNIDQNTHDTAYRATPPKDWPEDGRWRPSIHMPRHASRITLEITDVRVERLQEISEEDAAAEGVPSGHAGGEWSEEGLIEDFSSLWESINGPGSWDANPWVWVVEFRRADCCGGVEP